MEDPCVAEAGYWILRRGLVRPSEVGQPKEKKENESVSLYTNLLVKRLRMSDGMHKTTEPKSN